MYVKQSFQGKNESFNQSEDSIAMDESKTEPKAEPMPKHNPVTVNEK